MKAIKIGVIGFGNHMSSKLIPAIQNASKNSEIKYEMIAGCRLHDHENTKKKYDLKYITSDYKILISDPEIDVVFVALPDPNLQAQIAREAIMANKNIFVEKPVTYSLDCYKELAMMASEKNVATCEGFNLIHLPSLPHVKSKIDNNDISEFEIDCGIPSKENQVVDQETVLYGLHFAGIHPLSVIQYLFGMPSQMKIMNFDILKNTYDLTVYFLYEKKDANVRMRFHNKSQSGFSFVMNCIDKKLSSVCLDATKKDEQGISEKMKSHDLIVERFLKSIMDEKRFENNFTHCLDTHKMLLLISDGIKKTLGRSIFTNENKSTFFSLQDESMNEKDNIDKNKTLNKNF